MCMCLCICMSAPLQTCMDVSMCMSHAHAHVRMHSQKTSQMATDPGENVARIQTNISGTASKHVFHSVMVCRMFSPDFVLSNSVATFGHYAKKAASIVIHVFWMSAGSFCVSIGSASLPRSLILFRLILFVLRLLFCFCFSFSCFLFFFCLVCFLYLSCVCCLTRFLCFFCLLCFFYFCFFGFFWFF